MSKSDCEKACSSFDACLAYTYFEIRFTCSLYPSKTTFTKCPEGWHYMFGSGEDVMAEIVEEIVEHPSDERFYSECYRKIVKKTFQSW